MNDLAMMTNTARARIVTTTPKTNTKKALISVPRLGFDQPVERPGRIDPVDHLFIPGNGSHQAEIDRFAPFINVRRRKCH